MPQGYTEASELAQARLSAADPQRPIAVMNLFALREHANYTPSDPEFGTAAARVSGSEALERYISIAWPIVTSLGGRHIFGADIEQTYIGPADAPWDRTAVLWLPTRQAFVDMLASPEHRAASRHRDAALANWRQFHIDGRAFLN